MMYSREVEEMCVVNKGANHACAPIPVEGNGYKLHKYQIFQG